MAELKFNIVKTIAKISESPKGWNKELNLISWNDRPAKYDIRDWSPDHEKMGKGITLTKEELIALKEALEELDTD
ncbi:PC4/YdbC family ssDNA-binding protein [Evansella sp. AB-P1]|uniref:YdbC family protein n=1 Tax=Evansella sp. AB-P1 TaxID=3037653 RepID=UPI00241F9468|nr:PC4/YdbC family ssDNA-binding protein [Evansella sp. AB-P1]MDG5789060.1 PC4/YdbC family ssDNA-binding protein [Evansella sp. AB-P1]